MMHCVFVYGTLRLGGANHAYLRMGRFLGRFTTPASYTMLNVGQYPGVVDGGRDAIHGEVYMVNPRILQRLDRLEDVPRSYHRARLETPWGLAWWYVFRPAGLCLPRIGGGDWLRRPIGVARSYRC